MRQLMSRVKSFTVQDEGATMVEYGLMVALIAIACIGAIALVGTRTRSTRDVGGASRAGPGSPCSRS
jgi:pilus assembly protein Flp/PilA